MFLFICSYTLNQTFVWFCIVGYITICYESRILVGLHIQMNMNKLKKKTQTNTKTEAERETLKY